jgi:hypothetical protein
MMTFSKVKEEEDRYCQQQPGERQTCLPFRQPDQLRRLPAKKVARTGLPDKLFYSLFAFATIHQPSILVLQFGKNV